MLTETGTRSLQYRATCHRVCTIVIFESSRRYYALDWAASTAHDLFTYYVTKKDTEGLSCLRSSLKFGTSVAGTVRYKTRRTFWWMALVHGLIKLLLLSFGRLSQWLLISTENMHSKTCFKNDLTFLSKIWCWARRTFCKKYVKAFE